MSNASVESSSTHTAISPSFQKVDIIRLIGELAPTLEDHSIREKIPQMLISMWTDSDNEVRATAIQMIQSLLSIGFDELTSVFDGEVMLEVSRLLGNAEYGEKEELQSLLEWRFNQPKLTR